MTDVSGGVDRDTPEQCYEHDVVGCTACFVDRDTTTEPERRVIVQLKDAATGAVLFTGGIVEPTDFVDWVTSVNQPAILTCEVHQFPMPVVEFEPATELRGSSGE